MSDETKAAIERLRVYADAGLKAHIGIDLNTDVLAICNAAERGEADTKRLDYWLKRANGDVHWNIIYLSREAIDAAMKEGK